MSEKERLEGVNLQMSAIFVRLDALKECLPQFEREKYDRIIERKIQEFKEKYDLNPSKLEEWFR